MLADALEFIADIFLDLMSVRSEKKGWTFVSVLIAVAAGCLLAVLCGLEMGFGFVLLAIIAAVPVLSVLLYLRKLK